MEFRLNQHSAFLSQTWTSTNLSNLWSETLSYSCYFVSFCFQWFRGFLVVFLLLRGYCNLLKRGWFKHFTVIASWAEHNGFSRKGEFHLARCHPINNIMNLHGCRHIINVIFLFKITVSCTCTLLQHFKTGAKNLCIGLVWQHTTKLEESLVSAKICCKIYFQDINFSTYPPTEYLFLDSSSMLRNWL